MITYKSHRIKCKLTVVLLLLMNGVLVKGQDVYQTFNGLMVVTAVTNQDSVLKITNKELVIQLNYETAKFTIKMDKSNFRTNIDSLDNKLKQLKYDIVEIEGKLGLERINTDGHPPLEFDVEGEISTNYNIIKGTGRLEHISSRGTFSCLLTLKFNITISSLGLDIGTLELADEIQIEIVQTVLNKVNDQ